MKIPYLQIIGLAAAGTALFFLSRGDRMGAMLFGIVAHQFFQSAYLRGVNHE